ncbi:MAG: hypothetical protein WBQ13_12265, partial [Terriglobales bacterium]
VPVLLWTIAADSPSGEVRDFIAGSLVKFRSTGAGLLTKQPWEQDWLRPWEKSSEPEALDSDPTRAFA